ncbi:glycine betaine ABC transporter substrate-binding protein [Agrobacterium tumefaciens]|uniref:ABC transporter substrate-binding protein n=1 Tax=Agrobacterium tumefaciens TaxID=358 RepID=A0A2L2LLZ7_AGRTU|nr:glycine betaine ABC transporter substrate-binding protein [Agrobacterium tumefaciens]AVH45354.1 ABC transporter substrate-binding protein [Agrobacterium tumefaciens]NSY99081.1 ABC transporter substrate-binding protein [Agrobacterium tumefaciens]
MRRFLLAAVAATPFMSGAAAHAACGEISLSAFNWQSAEVNTYVDQFILNNGYGCDASVVAGDTVPTLTSMIEKGQPDISPAVAPSVIGELYVNGVAEGRVMQIGTAISDGSVSGWYVPKYLVDAHPDIKTVDNALKHPELFPTPEDPSKGGVIQGPQGWGDTVVTEQLFKALEAAKKGFVLVPTGSAAALDGAISKAYERKQGFIAAYWAPTSLLVKYPMVRLEGVAHDAAEWARCTSVLDCPDPKPNYWKPAEEVTVATAEFMKRDDIAPVKDYFAKRSWTQEEVSKIMLWMTENQANGQDGAKWFLENMPEVWTKWVPADVAEKIKAAI